MQTYRASGVQDLDSVELGLLSDTIRLGADGSGNVSAVAVAIGSGTVTGVVGQVSSTALELGVRNLDTSVDDVRARVGTGSAVVDVGRRARVGLGDTGKTPGSRALGNVGLLLKRRRLAELGGDVSVLLNVLNL